MYSIKVSSLRAARTHAAVKDVRFYLCGVFFDMQAGRMVATDGHRMLVCEGPQDAQTSSFILSNEHIDAVLKLAKGRHAPNTVTLEIDGPEYVRIHVGENIITQKRIDGTFPDYKRVIPRQFSQVPGQYNGQYLADARDALAIYFDRKEKNLAPRFEYNGTSAGILHLNQPGCFVVIMPIRTDDAMNRDMAAFIDCVTDTPAQAAA